MKKMVWLCGVLMTVATPKIRASSALIIDIDKPDQDNDGLELSELLR